MSKENGNAEVIYAPDADDDLESIVDYIARDKPKAARKWLENLKETCRTLADESGLGEERAGYGIPGCKTFSVGQYVIFFRPIDGGIEVSRVIHGSRDL